jgi:hypothetical protein
MLMIPEAAIVTAAEAFDACGLVTGEKEAIPDPCDSREILVERVFEMPNRLPIGKGEGNLGDGFCEAAS